MFKHISILVICFITFFISLATAQNQIIIIQPNGGEVYQNMDNVDIRWLNPNNINVDIYYSTDSGKSWILIAVNQSGTIYNWKPAPDIESNTCKIKIVSSEIIHPNVYGFNSGEPRYSYDGKYIVIFNENFIEVYSADDYKLLNTFFIYNTLNCTLNHSKNDILITYNNGDIETKEIPTGRTIAKFNTGFSIKYKAVYSPDAKRIGVLSDDSKFHIFDCDEFKEINTVKLSDTAYFVNWFANDTIGILAYGKAFTGFQMVDLIKGNVIFEDRNVTPKASNVFSASPDLKFYVLEIGRSACIYTLKDLKRITTITVSPFIHYASAWSKDSKTLYLANGDSSLRIYDTEYFLEKSNFHNNSGYINTLSLNQDETKIVYHDRYNHYKLVTASNFSSISDIPTPPSKDIYSKISPDNKILMTYGSDSTIRFWDADLNEKLLYSETNTSGSITGAEWSPNGKLIAIVKDKEIVIKSSDNFTTLKKIDFRDYNPAVIQIFPKLWTLDSKFFSVNYGDTAYFFDSTTWQLARKFQAYYFAFTHDSDIILYQSDQFNLKYYSVSQNKVIDSFATTKWIADSKLHPNKNRIYYRDYVSGSLGALAFYDYKLKYLSREYDCGCYAINDFEFNEKNEVLMVIDTLISPAMHNLALRLVDSNYATKDQRYFPTVLTAQYKIKWINNSSRYLYINNNVPFIDTLNVKIESDESDNVFTIGCPKLTLNAINMGVFTNCTSEEVLIKNAITNLNSTSMTIDSISFIGKFANNFILVDPKCPVGISGNSNLDITIKAICAGRDTVSASMRVYTKCGVIENTISAVFNIKPLTLYPNPTKDNINIRVRCDKAGDYKLKIYDLKGRSVESIEWKITDIANEELIRTYNINMNKYSQASYYVYFITPDKIYSDGFVYCKE